MYGGFNLAKDNSKFRESLVKLGDWSLPSIWCTRHRLIHGLPMRFFSKKDLFCHRPWLIAPLDDLSKDVVVMKSRQLGFTEIMLSKAIWFASLIGVTIVYTMPKGKKQEEIARERLDPLGYEWSNNRLSPGMRSLLVDWKASTLHKHLSPLYGGGRSSILVQAAFKEGGESTGESTAGDILFLDEFDRMNPQVEAAFDQSLSSSKLGIKHVFSTPTYPNKGVDRKYNASDRKRYFFKCNHCGHWQPLRRENILQVKGSKDLVQRLEAHDDTARFPPGTFIIACLKCKKEIDRHSTKAEWVAEQKSDISGYRMSKLDFAAKTADSIMLELRELKPGLGPWMWYVLGEAYLGEHGRLEEGWIYTMIDTTFPKFKSGKESREKYPDIKIGIGVDWGSSNWYVVKGKLPDRPLPIILSAGVFFDESNLDGDEASRRSGERMAQISEIWEPNAVIADFGYGKERNPYLYRKYGYKFYACDYSGKMNTTIPAWGKNPPAITKSLPIVKVDRDTSLESILMDVRLQRFSVAPLDEEILELMDKHFRNVVIRVYEDDKGKLEKEAVDIGDDHLLHADNYANLALTLAHRTTLGVGEINMGEKPRSKLEQAMQEHGYGRFDIVEQLMVDNELFKLL